MTTLDLVPGAQLFAPPPGYKEVFVCVSSIVPSSYIPHIPPPVSHPATVSHPDRRQAPITPSSTRLPIPRLLRRQVCQPVVRGAIGRQGESSELIVVSSTENRAIYEITTAARLRPYLSLFVCCTHIRVLDTSFSKFIWTRDDSTTSLDILET